MIHRFSITRPLAPLAALLVLSARGPAPPTWTRVLDRPIPGKYEDVTFVDSLHGWVADAMGSVLRTTDGGRTWTEQARKMGALRSIEFLDRRRGFVSSLDGKLFATTDSGRTWNDITATLPAATRGFCGIAHSGERLYLVGRYDGPADYLRSDDGGRTWHADQLTALARGLTDIELVSDSVVLIGGRAPSAADGTGGGAVVLRSEDAGRHWRTVYTLDVPNTYAWKLFVVSPSVVYVAIETYDATLRVAKSRDGGRTWSTQVVATMTARGRSLQGVGFVDENTGWVGGFLRGMYATADGGQTWAPLDVPVTTVNRYARAGSTLVTAGSTGLFRLDR